MRTNARNSLKESKDGKVEIRMWSEFIVFASLSTHLMAKGISKFVKTPDRVAYNSNSSTL